MEFYMKKILLKTLAVTFGLTMFTGCIEEYDPQTSYVSSDQAAEAPGAFQNFVNGITAPLIGEFNYSNDMYPFDFGYPSFYLQRDLMGQDIVPGNGGNYFSSWYASDVSLGPQYMICQIPWTIYYNWIKNCNTVIQMAGEEPDRDFRSITCLL